MSDYSNYDIKQLREAVTGADVNALADSGLLDEDVIDYLVTFEKAYTPKSSPHYETGDPAYYPHNTEIYQDIIKRQTSKNLRKAVQNNNESIIQFALGFQKSSKLELDFVEYEKFRKYLTEPGAMFNISGDTGTGKTMTGFRMAEAWLTINQHGLILTNVLSAAEDEDQVEYVTGYVDLIQWCIDNPHRPAIVVLDELSTKMSGYSGDRDTTEKLMQPLTRKARKKPFQMSFINITHRDVADLHPALRDPDVSHQVYKSGTTKQEAQKNLQLYEDSSKDPDKLLCELDGIGLPDITVDTNDDGVWDWGSDEELLQLGYELQDVSGHDDMLNLISNFDEAEDGEDEVEPTQCKHMKEDGTQCGSLVYDPEEEYCDYHKHQHT